MIKIDTVLNKLKNVKSISSDSYIASCPLPGHGSIDKNPSLSIKKKGEDDFILYCHKCGSVFNEVLEELGLHISNADKTERKATFEDKILATYSYVNEDGQILYVKYRMNSKEKFLIQREINGNIFMSLEAGKYYKITNTKNIYSKNTDYKENESISNIEKCKTVLYNLDNLSKADESTTVFIVEGEKDVETLKKLGLIATTTTSRKWLKEYNKYFSGLKVVIIPDNDVVGWEYALEVQKNISTFAEDVRILKLKGMGYKEDITDWLDYGHTKEELLKLCDNLIRNKDRITSVPAEVIKLEEQINFEKQAKMLGVTTVELIRKKEIEKAKEVAEYGDWYKLHAKTNAKIGVIVGNLVNYIRSKHHIMTLYDDVYIYQGGVYTVWEDIDNYIDSLISDEISPRGSWISEVLNILKTRTNIPDRDVDKVVLKNTTDYINFQNGILEVETGRLLPHDPNKKFIIQVKANYNPDARCPRFMQYLSESTLEENNKTIQELIGYFLTSSVRAKKFVVLLGQPHTGKSVFLELISNLYEQKFVSNLSLQNLANDKYSSAYLYNKALNVCGDLPNDPLRDIGIIKMLTGDDFIQSQRKYKDDIQFKNFSKLIFSANELPANYSGDKTDAFYSRLLILKFDKIPVQPDENLPIKLIEEIDGIVNWGIEGLKRLKENRMKITESRSSIEEREQYKKENNNILQFIDKVGLRNQKGYYTSSDALYDLYATLNKAAIPQQKFIKEIAQALDLNELQIYTDGRNKRRINVKYKESGKTSKMTVIEGLYCEDAQSIYNTISYPTNAYDVVVDRINKLEYLKYQERKVIPIQKKQNTEVEIDQIKIKDIVMINDEDMPFSNNE